MLLIQPASTATPVDIVHPVYNVAPRWWSDAAKGMRVAPSSHLGGRIPLASVVTVGLVNRMASAAIPAAVHGTIGEPITGDIVILALPWQLSTLARSSEPSSSKPSASFS